MSSRVPIVVVLGATGTGKSKLAIQIAKKFNGEIISADSMQVYHGLDITSNKVTPAEKAEIPHHMLDICRPMDRFSVMDFRHRTLPIIDDILKRRKLPIIVGGTHYYIDSILYDCLTSGPTIEGDELVNTHCHVLNNPEMVNKWRTYEASVRPLLKQEPSTSDDSASIWQPATTKSACITPDHLVQVFDDINVLTCRFEELVQNIASQLNIAIPIYLRTFYQLPEFSRRVGHMSEVVTSALQSEINCTNFVKAEMALLNHYLYTCLREIIDTFDDEDENWPASDLCREYIATCWGSKNITAVINDALLSKADLSECREKIIQLSFTNSRSLVKFHQAICDLLANLKEISTLRLKRLVLLRIIDDECMLDYSNDELYNVLKNVDLEAVGLMHPNNRRKVIRALQIYFQDGKPYTKFIEEQHNQEGGGGVYAPMRFPDTCVFWLTCNQTILDKRLNERVDKMMESGLIEELEKFHEQYNVDRLKHNIMADYTKGIFQSIGLKEFHPYLMLSHEEKSSPEGKRLLRAGVNQMKMITSRYSKSQYRFVFNHYVSIPPGKTVPPVFELDCTNVDEWDEKVRTVAFEIINAYLSGENLNHLQHSPVSVQEPDDARYQFGKFFCDICQRLFIGQYQWLAHCTSKGHRKQIYQIKVKEFQKKIASMGPTAAKEPNDVLDDGDILQLFN